MVLKFEKTSGTCQPKRLKFLIKKKNRKTYNSPGHATIILAETGRKDFLQSHNGKERSLIFKNEILKIEKALTCFVTLMMTIIATVNNTIKG